MFVCKFGMFDRCKVQMFVLKFILTMYNEPALQALIGYFTKPSNRIAHCLIVLNTWNEVLNKFQNIVINIPKHPSTYTFVFSYSLNFVILNLIKIIPDTLGVVLDASNLVYNV